MKLVTMFVSSVFFLLCLASVNAQVDITQAEQARNKAAAWLAKERRRDGTWKGATAARIVTALQLLDSNWIHKDDHSNSLQEMNKEILAMLIRTKNMTEGTAEEGAEAVQAIMATCQNPRKYHGINLVSMLRNKLDNIPSGAGTKNVAQVIVTILTLCSAGEKVPEKAVNRINTELKLTTSGSCPYCAEGASLTLLAVHCLRQSQPEMAILQGLRTRQSAFLKEKQEKDGSFGHLVATALALQATNALTTTQLNVNPATALSYVLGDQDSAGSFGNVDVTALVLPALIGRSALDIPKINCPPKPVDRKPNDGLVHMRLGMHDTIYAQREMENDVSGPAGRTLLQILNDESKKHPRAFKFTTAVNNGITVLTGVNGVINDTKNNWFWQVMRKADENSPAQPNSQSLDKIVPLQGEKYILRFGRLVS